MPRSLAAFVLFIAASALSLAAAAQDITLKFSHFLGPQSFFQRDVAEPWAKRLQDKTGGKAKVEVFDGTSPHGDVLKQASQVKDGTVDIPLGRRGAAGEPFPAPSVIALPFIVRDSQSGSNARGGLSKSGALGQEYSNDKVLALFVH